MDTYTWKCLAAHGAQSYMWVRLSHHQVRSALLVIPSQSEPVCKPSTEKSLLRRRRITVSLHHSAKSQVAVGISGTTFCVLSLRPAFGGFSGQES